MSLSASSQLARENRVSRRSVVASLVASALANTTVGGASAGAIERIESSSSIGRDYDRYAQNYNMLDGRSAVLPTALGLPELREAAVSATAGRVLEVACGTGANFPLYSQAPQAREVVAVDVSEGMLSEASKARAQVPEIKIELVQGDVVRGLPFRDGEFDSVLDTFSLCVIADPLAALQEMKRVLAKKSDSRAILLEHTVSTNRALALYQNATAGIVAKTSKGCFWNQDVMSLAQMAGFRVISQRYAVGGTVVLLELGHNG